MMRSSAAAATEHEKVNAAYCVLAMSGAVILGASVLYDPEHSYHHQ